MQNLPPDHDGSARQGGAAIWVALALFLLIVLSNLFMLRPRITDQIDTWSAKVMQADFTARMMYGNLLPFGAVRAEEWENILRTLTARNAPLGALVRAVILIEERRSTLGDRAAQERIRQILSRMATAPTRFSAAQRTALLKMCQVVYADRRPLQAKELSDFRRAVEEVNLGWMRLLALKHLELRAGNTEAAHRWEAQALREANRLQQTLLAVFAVVALMILMGMAAWVAYLAWKTSARRWQPSVPVLAREHADTVLWGLVAYFAATYVGGWIVGLLVHGVSLSTHFLVVLVLLVQVVTGTVSLWLLHWVMQRRGVTWRDLGLTWSPLLGHLAWGTGAYVAMVPLLLLTVVLVQILLPGLPSVAHPIAGVASAENPAWVNVLLFLVAGVFAPLFEEVFFRGVLLNALWARTGARWVGIAGSALVFSVLHPQLYLGWIAVFVIGVLLGMLFVERRSLVPCIWMHALNNTVALFATHLLRVGG